MRPNRRILPAIEFMSRKVSGPDSGRVGFGADQSIGALEAQTTRRVRLENGQLVTKSEELRLQGSAGPKNGGDQSTKGDEKRVHRGDRYDLTRNRKPRVFSSDGVFGSHSRLGIDRVASLDEHFAVFRFGPKRRQSFTIVR
jgi:hypothetical protein